MSKLPMTFDPRDSKGLQPFSPPGGPPEAKAEGLSGPAVSVSIETGETEHFGKGTLYRWTVPSDVECGPKGRANELLPGAGVSVQNLQRQVRRFEFC